jgi:hypothetical protein
MIEAAHFDADEIMLRKNIENHDINEAFTLCNLF